MMSEKVKQQKREMLVRHGAGVDNFVTVAHRLSMDQWELVRLAGECGLQVIHTRGKTWDIVEVAAMMTLRQKNVPWAVIAAAIGRSVAACNGFMGRIDREILSPASDPVTEDEILELKAQGLSLTKAAESCGVERQKFRTLCERHGISTTWGYVPWTHKEEREALQFHSEGLSYARIGARLGRTRHSVWQKLKTLESVEQ